MNNKKEMEDILQRSSLKENPFGTPKGYFETMRREVLETVSTMPVAPEYDETQEQEPATFKTYFVPAFSLAAMFGLIFGLGYGAMKLTGTGEEHGLPERTVLSENIGEEVSEQEAELSEDDMMNILHISIEDLVAAQNAEYEIEVEINGQEIEEYLIENRVPTSQLAMLEQY